MSIATGTTSFSEYEFVKSMPFYVKIFAGDRPILYRIKEAGKREFYDKITEMPRNGLGMPSTGYVKEIASALGESVEDISGLGMEMVMKSFTENNKTGYDIFIEHKNSKK